MTGFITMLLFALLYFVVVGTARYFMSKKTEIYYNGIDVIIAVFFAVFGGGTSLLTYTVGLGLLCGIILLLSNMVKPIGKFFFEKKYYAYKKVNDD